MLLWNILIALSIISVLLSLCYITRYLCSIGSETAFAQRRPFALRLLCISFVFGSAALLFGLLGPVDSAVILLHFAVFLLGTAALAKLLMRRCSKSTARIAAFCLALFLTTGYLGIAYQNAVRIRKTEYTVFTEKNDRQLRIALLSDAHIGQTFGTEALCNVVADINQQHPDVVFIVGDFIDENTPIQQIDTACAALRGLTAARGVYFVFGNHDAGFFEQQKQAKKVQALRNGLNESNVQILEDEGRTLGDGYFLIGRSDASTGSESGMPRDDVKTLLQSAPAGEYTILLDHQPTDYRAEAEAGADLVLSGHTHGGQLIPLNLAMQLFSVGGVDLVYGLKTIKHTVFCVTSGLSSWGMRFKSGCRSEYVILTIQPQESVSLQKVAEEAFCGA